MLGAEPVAIEIDGEKRWFVPLIDYCRLERRVEALELERNKALAQPPTSLQEVTK